MTVYVDSLFDAEPCTAQARRHGNTWCHLFTNGDPAELHEFAKRLGLQRRWAQTEFPEWRLHYDLVPSKRAVAIRMGAVEVTPREGAAIALQVLARTKERA